MKEQISLLTQLFISIALFTSFISCNPTITGEGPVVEVKKDADKFTKVDMQMEANVMITQGTENTVVIHAQQNIADAIETTLSGKSLKIYSNKNLEPSEPITIDITMNNIEGLEISGSGVMKSSGTIKTSELDLKVSGSGKIFIDAVCNNLKADISGSGEMTLKGSTTESDLEISGSGHLYAYDLLTQNTETEISGSGDAQVTTTEQLTTKISGSGSVTYKGNPAKVNPKISGSGTVKAAQ
ncbi:MAG: head GIN domain-containing protein [Bacteroidia bacterium]